MKREKPHAHRIVSFAMFVLFLIYYVDHPKPKSMSQSQGCTKVYKGFLLVSKTYSDYV